MRESECLVAVLWVVLLLAVVVGSIRIIVRLARVERTLEQMRDALGRIARRDAREHAAQDSDAAFVVPSSPPSSLTPSSPTPSSQTPSSQPSVAATRAAAAAVSPARAAPPPAPAPAPAADVGEARPAFPPPVPATPAVPPIEARPFEYGFPSAHVVRPAVPVPAAPRPAAEPFSLERFLGGRVLLVVGVVAILFCLGFFLKLAIERELLGPGGRLVTGMIAGAAALFAGERLRARGLSVFGQAIMGCGLGTLFLTDHFASVRYGFVSQPQAFALAAGVAALAAYLAISRDAPFLAWLGFAGAYLSPALLGRNQDALEGLTLWLVVVGLGLTVVLARRPWKLLDLLPIAASWAYFVLWRVEWYRPARADVAGVSVAALTAVLIVVAYAPALWGRRSVPATSHAAAALGLVVAIATVHDVLFPVRRYEIGAGIAVAGLVLAGLSAVARRRAPECVQDAAVLWTMALAALATAVPFLLGGNAVVVAWSAFGAALVHGASRTGSRATAGVGLATIACGLLAALVGPSELHGQAYTPFLNADFLSATAPPLALALAWRSLERGVERLRDASIPLLLGSTIVGSTLLLIETARARERGGAPASFLEAALVWGALVASGLTVAVAFLARRRESGVRAAAWAPLVAATLLGVWIVADGHLETFTPAANGPFAAGLAVAGVLFVAGALGTVGPAPGIAAVAYLFALITAEIHAWGDWPHAGLTDDQIRFRVQVGLSIAWTVYAAALVAFGFRWDRALFRWSGIGLFLVTAAKVFLVDLGRLSTVYRIGSFLVLGVLLVAVSYLYQRTRRTAEPPAPTAASGPPEPPPPPPAA